MKQRLFVLLTAVLILLLALSLFGCEKQDSENNQQTNDPPENVIVEKETTDYSGMSKEEIITEFMKAWENDDIAVMDELSDFPEDYRMGKNFEDNGYHAIFSWGNVSMTDNPVCDHGCENFSHSIYDLKIRQSDNSDYGCAPEELQSLHPEYEDIYIASFTMDENSIIRHLEKCIFGWKEGTLLSDDVFARDGVYGDGIIFEMFFDSEKGHWIIKEEKHALN